MTMMEMIAMMKRRNCPNARSASFLQREKQKGQETQTTKTCWMTMMMIICTYFHLLPAKGPDHGAAYRASHPNQMHRIVSGPRRTWKKWRDRISVRWS